MTEQEKVNTPLVNDYFKLKIREPGQEAKWVKLIGSNLHSTPFEEEAADWHTYTTGGKIAYTVTHKGYLGYSGSSGAACMRDYSQCSWLIPMPAGEKQNLCIDDGKHKLLVPRPNETQLYFGEEGTPLEVEWVSGTHVFWMKTLYDDKKCDFRNRKLGEIVIPGSHNAGTKGMEVGTECQYDDILAQLVAGSRFLDLRVRDNDSFDDAVFFHGALTSSNKLSDAVYQIKRFLNDKETQREIIIIRFFINKEALWTRVKTELADYSVMPLLKGKQKVAAEVTPAYLFEQDPKRQELRLILVNTAPNVNEADREEAKQNMVQDDVPGGNPYGRDSSDWQPYLDQLRLFVAPPPPGKSSKLWIWHLGHPSTPLNETNFLWFTRMFGRDYRQADPCPDLREVKLNILNVDFISKDYGEKLNWVHWIINLNRTPKTVEPGQIAKPPYAFKLKIQESGKEARWVKLIGDYLHSTPVEGEAAVWHSYTEDSAKQITYTVSDKGYLGYSGGSGEACMRAYGYCSWLITIPMPFTAGKQTLCIDDEKRNPLVSRPNQTQLYFDTNGTPLDVQYEVSISPGLETAPSPVLETISG